MKAGGALDNRINKLAALAREGDASAFGELYGIFSKEMYAYAFSITRDPHAAEDAVSEAVLSAFRQIGNLRDVSSFKGWLFRILHAESCKQYNVRMAHMTLDDTVNASRTDAGGIEDLELSLELSAALKVLTQEEKEIVLLKTVNEYTSKEISEITGIPHATVRSKLSRALAKLRKEIEKGGGTDE